jgi:hypothetical protein
MDPDQALTDARKACKHWHEGERGDYDFVALDELVNAFEALDQWLSRGGFLPRDWRSVTR